MGGKRELCHVVMLQGNLVSAGFQYGNLIFLKLS